MLAAREDKRVTGISAPVFNARGGSAQILYRVGGEPVSHSCYRLQRAGDGNRTRVTSLGSWRTTTVLHPRRSFRYRYLVFHYKRRESAVRLNCRMVRFKFSAAA